MTVESRFDINDKVWRMFRNKPHQGTISGVFIYIHDDVYEVTHSIMGSDDRIYENDLFSSKEELLKSL